MSLRYAGLKGLICTKPVQRFVVFVLFVCLALGVSSCSHSALSDAVNSTCDAEKAKDLEKQGYDLLNKGKWYDAHLVGHALMSIGSDCAQGEIAAPAMIHGIYMRGYVANQTRDVGQPRQFVNYGLAVLSKLKEHESESPVYSNLYDQMEPRFLEFRRRSISEGTSPG